MFVFYGSLSGHRRAGYVKQKEQRTTGIKMKEHDQIYIISPKRQ